MSTRLVVADDLAARLQALADARGVSAEELGLRAIALGLDILARQPGEIVGVDTQPSAAVAPQLSPHTPPRPELGDRDASGD